MKLSDYIEAMGDAKAAEKFGVKERTTESWRRGDRRPKPEKAKEIEVITEGLVKFSECYD